MGSWFCVFGRRFDRRMLVLLLVAGALAAVVGFSSGASTGATFAADPAGGAQRERELPAMRTRTSKTYLQPDGSYVTKAFLRSVNYRAADGSWRPIDTSVKKDGAAFRNGANAFDVSIPERLPGNVRLADGDRSFSFALRNADAAGSASGDRVRFADARPGVDLS